jgi:hypothetical protein
MITSMPRASALVANSVTRFGERWADMTCISFSMPSSVSSCWHGSSVGTSDLSRDDPYSASVSSSID